MSIYTYNIDLMETLGTRVAWENYDWFVETSSGKDTLHDTLGITYQVQIEDVLDFRSKENAITLKWLQLQLKQKSKEDVLLNQVG